jgi:hypothetical protein
MYTRNFKENKIKITFNEFLQLKNLNEQIIISPPLAVMPEFKLRGKTIQILIKEELKPNSTYNIFFGNAIGDLTENNPVENFQFIFSTGDVIDSLSIDGKLYNAWDLKPVKGVNIGLYLQGNDTIPLDSLPYFIKPYYLTKTNESGNFSLKNLANQSYLIFALNDKNGNMIFDQPSESIAFSDSLVTPYYLKAPFNDSISHDSGQVTKVAPLSLRPVPLGLALFQETDSIQRLLKVVVPNNYQVNFIFKRPVEHLIVESLHPEIQENWYIAEYNATRDTITYWIRNLGQDSLRMVLNENNFVDTINISLLKRTKGRRSEKDDLPQKKIELKNNLKNNLTDLNKPLTLTFGYPLASVDTSRIRVFENDTVGVNATFSFADSANRKFKVEYPWKKATAYSLHLFDSAFIDIHHSTNDSILIQFSSKSNEDYGNLIIQFTPKQASMNYIVQLLSGENVVRETFVAGEEKVSFTYLTPGKYRVRAIYDANNNGKWDTGHYIYKMQPEKVAFFPIEITIRANWDMEEAWELE